MLCNGPPPGVSTYTGSKTWNAPMTEITNTNRVVGRSIGRVMRQKTCQEEAPSTRAAS